MYVVISVVHLARYNRVFVHGIFQDRQEASKVAEDIENDLTFVTEEGYELSREDRGISVYVSDIPMGVRVNDLVALAHDM